MKILERNVQRDTDRIIQDEGEILKIEKKENEILDSLKRQTDKIGTLWKDERVLQDRLKQVISEERSLIENLSFLSEGIEASSDIALEFNGFLMMLERLTDVVIDTEARVTSVLRKQVSIEDLPIAEFRSSIDYRKNALRGATTLIETGKQGFKIVTAIPKIVDRFAIF